MAKSILAKEEIQWFIDLGLGRGVDSTNPRPWLNKSAFQVRNATFNNVLGTDEGGFLQTYRHSIASSKDFQAQLKSSVAVPNSPVSFGLEGEVSRSSTATKKVIGKKIINRTIAFRSFMEPESNTDQGASRESLAVSSETASFEETLSAWIWKQVCDRRELKLDSQHEGVKGAIALLGKYLQEASREEVVLVVDDCADFVCSFGVTHYVCSITLGASEHTVMTDTQYSTILKQGLNVSATQFASVKEKSALKLKSSKTSLTTQHFGKIVNNEVERGSNNEAVIEVKILPIHSLIRRNHFVHLALYKALTDYAEEKATQPTGPFVVECRDEQMYWKVVEASYLLTTTKEIKDASIFHVIPDDETDDQYDFSIGWQGETLQDLVDRDCLATADKASTKIMRYLEVKTFFFGHYHGPLKLKSELSSNDSRLCLYNQIISDPPADFTPWTEEKKVFFISSSSCKSFIAVNSYRNVQQADPASEDAYKYTTKCVGSRTAHDENNTWMLFRLLPADSCTDDAQAKRKSVLEGSKRRLSEKLTKLLET